MKDWKMVLVVAAMAALLVFTWGPFACGQDCPPGGCPAPQARGLDVGGWRGSPQRIHGEAADYIVKLSGGTGTLIYNDGERGVILTAYHVVQGGPRKEIPVTFPDGKTFLANAIVEKDGGTIARDTEADLAFLEIRSPSAEPCKLASRRPGQGDRVTICGYGKDRKFAATPAAVTGYDVSGRLLKMSGEAKPGDSGGPIFNSQGELVAVVSASTWADPRQPDWTVGGHVGVIYQMCQDDRYWWPWNAKTAQERLRSQSEVDQERLRAESEIEQERLRSQHQQHQQPPVFPYPMPGPGADLSGIEQRLDRLEESDKAQAEKIVYFDQIVASVKEKTAILEKSNSELDQSLAAKIRDVQSNVLNELGGKVDDAAAAVDGKAEAVAKDVAKKTVEEATPGLLEKIGEKLPPGISGIWNYVTGSYIGLGAVGLLLFIVWKDVRDYIKTGGQDKLIIQHLMGLAGRGAERTANTIDDRLVGGLSSRIDDLAAKLQRFSPPSPPPA